jgi:hypothetical protein
MSEMTLKERVTAFKCFELPGQPMFAHIGTSYLVTDLSNEVERLENELLAATIRIDNDTMEIARLTPLQYRQAPCHKFCEATAFKVEIRELKAERDAAIAELATIKLQEPVAFLELSRVTGEWFLSYIAKKDVKQKSLYLTPGAQPKTCIWTLDDDESNTWASSCGELWSFIEGGPDENRVSYCHHCGGKVVKGESL